MARDDRERNRGDRGVPDGLLIGVLAFLLGMTILVWTATGLSGRFAKGAWPDEVTFAHTPLAMRHLIGRPHDITGAWPNTPDDQLSGYGLFWGLFIGQVMILLVLTVFTAGTLARWRAVRRQGREDALYEKPRKGRGELRENPDERAPEKTLEPTPLEAPRAKPSRTGRDGEEGTTPKTSATPEPAPVPTPAPTPTPVPPPPTAPETPLAATPLPLPRTPLHLGPPSHRHPLAIEAVREAAGPALVITSAPTVWQETKDARAKLGPVLLYDPTHLCDTPARLHWNPSAGCENRSTAADRAIALLAPIRPTARLDSALAETADTLLRSYLHAAAVEGKPFRHVHRWAQGSQVQEAVRILRTNPKATSGTAGELEAALTAHPERRDMAQELTARALSSLFTVHIRDACTPNRTDALTLDSFIAEGGTLYVVGEPIEDPKGNPGAMPLLTALASSVVEHGRRMAERSPAGRLDPPMTLVLDDVAAVAPLPQLPELLATGADRGLETLALLRSREQGRTRWPDAELPLPLP
ncbi:type IV secretory system conjugative DNA transfer family protein [Streptomyces sp. HUAS MG91]|uniref:Type IV secretory system conjugative DNA transfer family protein n=1 Tax=Streptomyces tabacisoli TaxID=3156398 RepID=A0AAU8IWS3_9ACTN